VTGLRIVRRPDPRHQQKLGVRHRERRKYDDVGRLFVLLAGYASGEFAAGKGKGL
jgi:hypothetical protein